VQPEPLPPTSAEPTRADHDLVNRIMGSALFRDYQEAFETITGLPLTIRAIGSFQPPLDGSRRINPLCALMAGRNKTCSACLQLQQRVETEAFDRAVTRECFAGLNDSAVPVRVGDRVIAFLQTGQVLFRKPTEARFKRTARLLGEWEAGIDLRQLREAFFAMRTVNRGQYESTLRLLSIFAQHLADMANQIMVRETTAEAPPVARARAFIADHLGDKISLPEVAGAVHMSAFYFCKVFKKSTGLTFSDYLARVRVEAVKKLLLNQNKRVSEAAYEAGFQSLSQFNRTFNRLAGESPTDFRTRLSSSGRPAVRLTVAA
jgi:AraC-like DNA-binding protein/ligand-binding sensor protein